MYVSSTEGQIVGIFPRHVAIYWCKKHWESSRVLTSHCSSLLDSFPPDSSMTLRISSNSFSAFATSSLESLSCLQRKHKLKDDRWDTLTMNRNVLFFFYFVLTTEKHAHNHAGTENLHRLFFFKNKTPTSPFHFTSSTCKLLLTPINIMLFFLFYIAFGLSQQLAFWDCSSDNESLSDK